MSTSTDDVGEEVLKTIVVVLVTKTAVLYVYAAGLFNRRRNQLFIANFNLLLTFSAVTNEHYDTLCLITRNGVLVTIVLCSEDVYYQWVR